MPWKVPNVSEIRFAACHAVRSLHRPVAAVARQFHISRKTLHKWLCIFDAQPQPASSHLSDRSRRPRCSPRQTPPDAEQAVLAVRDTFNWGPRKIHGFIAQQQILPPEQRPALRTIAHILRRHGRITPPTSTPQPQRFERSAPNQLWQVDHKGPLEIQRQKVMPLSVLDDDSRYCRPFTPPAWT